LSNKYSRHVRRLSNYSNISEPSIYLHAILYVDCMMHVVQLHSQFQYAQLKQSLFS